MVYVKYSNDYDTPLMERQHIFCQNRNKGSAYFIHYNKSAFFVSDRDITYFLMNRIANKYLNVIRIVDDLQKY